ncbi:MAG: GNAT family N-acetyltransferase [Bacteroidetes bacterium]|nr:MAG: GNAT family N-acetyltransferase [Bacteroidota bacterium]
MHQAFCQIIPLDRYNWELCLKIEMKPEQRAYMPSVLYSIAQSKFENLEPYGIMHRGKMVGFIMYGNFGGICWINRIVIDKDHQRKGLGRAAMKQLLEILKGKIRCKEIRTSYATSNHVAAAFFASLGFQPLPSNFDDEVIAQYRS